MTTRKISRSKEERHTAFVVAFSAVVMLLEIVVGLLSGSMALLANGIHMGGHVMAFGLTLGAYVLVRNLRKAGNEHYSGDRILALAAFASGVLLLVFAVLITVEAAERIAGGGEPIKFAEAMTITIAGMAVNLICAYALHFKHGEGDYNSHSAFLHVVADAMTGVGTIVGLLCVKLWGITWIDSAVAIVCSIIIIKWAIGLLLDTGRRLITVA